MSGLRRGVCLSVLLLGIFAPVSCTHSRSNSLRRNNDLSAYTRNQPLVYMALGDSTGMGLGARDGGYVERLLARLQRTHPEARLINLCIAGATTTDVVYKELGRYSGSRPTFVTLSIGINDLMRGVTEPHFADDYEEAIVSLKKFEIPIIVTNLPDVSLAPALPEYLRESTRRRVLIFNEHIEEIAMRRGLLLVDLYVKSREVIPSHPEFFSADGFHPSDDGYEFWTDVMWSAVEEVATE